MTTTPATVESAPHSAVAYILPAVHSKRVRTVAADGAEEEADDNPWLRMQLKDPFEQTQPVDAAAAAEGTTANGTEAAAEQQQEEEQPRPEEVIKSFAAAKGELEWLNAMLSTLQEGRYLTVGRSERGKAQQDKAQIFADLAVQANSRFRRRSAAAAAASAALVEGAAALRALGQKEDTLYAQVAQLQRYWKVRQEPASSPYAYSVNLSLAPPDSSSSNSSSSAAAGPDAAAMVGRGPVDVIYILKDPAGNLRVQVPALKTPGPPSVTFKGLEQPPEVYTGPAAIHALLLRQLRLNAWHMVVNSLDEEISSMLNLPTHLRHALSLPLRQQSQGAQQFLDAAAAQQQQQQQQQPGPKFAEISGHLALFASLSSLVLQAVAGSAGTAGEAVLQQQQQQQQQHGDPMVVDLSGPHGAESADGPGLSLYDSDVGQPWQAAAAGDGEGGGSNSSDGGSSRTPRVVVDPQLLSMRPLALDHLLVTQLGHLVASLRHTNDPMLMAPIAYAAASRQMHDRARQRLQQQQQQQQQQIGRSEEAGGSAAAAAAAASAGASQLGLKPGSLLFGRQISLLHCFARWLQHAAHREVLRAQVDGVLRQQPGMAAQYVSSTHFCVSAMQVGRSHLPAAPAASGRSNSQQQQPQQEETAAAVSPSVLLLLADGQLSVETSAVTAPAAASGTSAVKQGSTGWLRPAAQSAISVQLHGIASVLEQLLRQL